MALYRIKDSVDDNSASSLFRMSDFKAPDSSILEKVDPFLFTTNTIKVKKNSMFLLNSGGTYKPYQVKTDDLVLTVADLDTGTAFVFGSDYYVYLCDDGLDGVFKISLNATYPSGYTADNSRKIGGFHYGMIRRVNSNYVPVDSNGTLFGTAWKTYTAIGIIQNSVWDLKNRPICSPEGMVKIDANFWADIYLSSAAEAISFQTATNGLHVAGGKLQSKFGGTPVTGTEGCNQYNFNELAMRSGKRLPRFAEWLQAAYGNPEGEDAADNYGWTKTANTGRYPTGCSLNASGIYVEGGSVKPYAVSAKNICDAIGNVYEWQADYCIRQDSTSWAWQDVPGAGMGDIYAPNNVGLTAFIAGGDWSEGAHCGARTVRLIIYPWGVGTSIGCRLACDAL
jgi:hypothetical protein